MRKSIKSLLLCFLFSWLAGCCCQNNSAAKTGGWEVLFDGKSVAHWRGYNHPDFPDKTWKVENGTLRTVLGSPTVDLITREQYGDFELELEWRISPGGNSGVLYLVGEGDKADYHSGPEMQILDDGEHLNAHQALTSCGALYDLIAPVNKHLKPVGEWNQIRILVNGNHVEHWLNGDKIVEYELHSEALNKLIAQSKFKDEPRFAKLKPGYISLQFHKSEVWFRNIRVRRL